MANTDPSRFFPATVALLLLSSTLLLTSAAPTSAPPPQRRQSPRRLQSPPPPSHHPPPPAPSHHPPPPPPPALGCSTEVLAFSPCLPYISNPPNNLTDSPSILCCNAFESAFRAGEANCLCYIARQTSMFGFPINATKLYSLSSLCPKIDNVTDGNGTLQSICSVSAALPPLSSTPGSGFSTPHNLDFGSSLPPISLPLPKPAGDLVPPESADHAPSQPPAPVISANLPSSSEQLFKNQIWMMSHTLLLSVSLTLLPIHLSS